MPAATDCINDVNPSTRTTSFQCVIRGGNDYSITQKPLHDNRGFFAYFRAILSAIF